MVTTVILPANIQTSYTVQLAKIRQRKKVLKTELLNLENKVQKVRDALQQCAQEEFSLTQKQLF